MEEIVYLRAKHLDKAIINRELHRMHQIELSSTLILPTHAPFSHNSNGSSLVSKSHQY
jgi:hypothetical protein